MHTTAKTLLLAAIVGTTMSSFAEPAATGPNTAETRCMPAGEHSASHRHAAGAHKDRLAQDLERLKTQLALQPQQEAAWQSFTSALSAGRPERGTPREEMMKLSTPERLDKLQELRKQRDAKMAQTEAATRAFYSQLTPEQQAKFDESTRRFWRGPHA